MATNYSHETWSTVFTNPDGTTSGVPIGHMVLTPDEKDIINLAFSSSSPFVNTIAGDITISKNDIDLIVTALNVRNDDTYDPLYTQLNTLISNITTLGDRLNSSSDDPNFLNHTNRLTGTSGGKTWLKNDGELYGFGGVQGVASAYNSVKEAMRDDDDPVEDNYSIFFTSILIAGKSLISDILDFVDGGERVDGITIGEIISTDVSSMETKSSDLSTAIYDNINADNNQLSFSVDYLKKFGHGNMILGMNKDTYFGRRLLDDIQSDTLKSELEDIG